MQCNFLMRTFLIAFGVFFIVLATFVAIFLIKGYYDKAVEPQRIAETKQTILNLAQEIELLRKKTGSIPEDEENLVELRGSAMPLTAWGDPLKYRRIENQYRVSAMTEGKLSGMMYGYRSDGDGHVIRYSF